jgi:hypothetical protein
LQTITPEAFLQVLMSINQFKMLGAKSLLDPTLMLSLVSKLSSVVTLNNNVNTTSVAFFKQCSSLLSLWPNFWGTASTSGLSTSSYVDLVSSMVAFSSGGVANNPTTLLNSYSSLFSTATTNPADSLLNIMSAIGNVMSEGDFSAPQATTVSVTSFMSVMGAYTSLLSLVK